MGVFASDVFVGSDGAAISGASSGGTWTKTTAVGSTGDIFYFSNTAILASGTPGCWFLDAAPAADYYVQGVVTTGTAGSGGVAAVGGRLDSTSALNGYWIDYYDHATAGSRVVRLIRINTGAGTGVLGSYTTNLGSAGSATLRLVMQGSSISGYVDGVLRIGPVTDTNLAGAGRPFINLDYGGSVPASYAGAKSGPVIDNFEAATFGASPPLKRRRLSGLYIR